MTTVQSAERSTRRGPLFALREWWRNFTLPARRFPDVVDRQRATALIGIIVFMVGLAVVGSAILILILSLPLSTAILGLWGILILFVFVIRGWIEGGRLGLASFVFIGLIYALVFYAEFLMPAVQVTGTIMVLPILLAAFLLGPGWTYGAALASIATTVFLVYRAALAPAVPGTESIGVDFFVMGGTIGTSALVFIFTGLIANLIVTSLRQIAANATRQTAQLSAAALVAEAASTAPTLTTLLNVVVERIRDAFGFYHAQVFLMDEDGRLARLEASTGRAGIALLARGHALRVGSQSVIGQATFLGDSVVVNDTAFSDIWRPNELLPDTRAELALPLMSGDTVIGALDVQSTQPNVFEPEDIRTLEIMAQQVATTIERARLVDELQTRAAENERLFTEAQRNLLQIEDLNRRLTREGWTDYLRAQQEREMGYTLTGSEVRTDHEWTAPMRQAYSGESSVVVRQDDQAHIAAVPLRVRGEVIGVLELQREGNRPWSNDDLEMAEALVERLGLAVENARLYEQATEATEREQIINRIAEEVQAAETVDDVLRSALAELGNVLGASHGVVQISPRARQPQVRPGGTGYLSPTPDNGAQSTD